MQLDLNAGIARHRSLDAMRGIAVMAILLMNILAFALPFGAYVNPRAAGGTSLADLTTWATMFVLVDGKMRGLFSLMFGASMLLVIEGTEAKGGDGTGAHSRRMVWLMLFGLIHGYLIWHGDILFTYAVCGLTAVFLVGMGQSALIRWAIALMIANLLIWVATIGATYGMQVAATAPGADPELVEGYRAMLDAFGMPGSTDIANEIKAFSGSYGDAVAYRTNADNALTPIAFVLTGGLETIGLFALGMVLLRNGFLTGGWERARYAKTATLSYLIGIPPLILLATWAWAGGFDVMTTAAIVFLLAIPFKYAVMLGHGALAMLFITRFSAAPIMGRIEAAGRAAFTNYLGTSLLMTTLFYGYGGGLFGQLSRWQVYLIVPLVWAIMLAWSQPWLARYRYGPLEWLWRSLARGERQAMRLP